MHGWEHTLEWVIYSVMPAEFIVYVHFTDSVVIYRMHSERTGMKEVVSDKRCSRRKGLRVLLLHIIILCDFT